MSGVRHRGGDTLAALSARVRSLPPKAQEAFDRKLTPELRLAMRSFADGGVPMSWGKQVAALVDEALREAAA